MDSSDESREGRGAVAASLLMLGVLVFGIIEVTQRNTSLTNTRALLEIGVVLALSLVLGFAARFLARALTRLRTG